MNKLKTYLKAHTILSLAIVSIFIFSVYIGVRKIKKDKEYEAQLMEIKPGDTLVDLDGDGDDEIVRYSSLISKDHLYMVESLVAYNEIGEEIGRLPEDLPIQKPLPNSALAFTPDKMDGRQFISYEFVTGPHSSMTMVFGFFELKTGEMGLLPVCLTKNVESAFDCLFWSGQIDSLVINDLDDDGTIEIVEMVDEYPKDGEVTSDIVKMIDKEFEDLGQDKADGMVRIAKREQGGRGNRVVWRIYRFNGDIFDEQLDSDYERYYVLAEEYLRKSNSKYPTVMRWNEMSQESLEYNEFLEDYWVKN